MNSDLHCPRCGQPTTQKPACIHLRWRPERGGPIDFAKSIISDKARPGVASAGIPEQWWESHFDWLLERIMVRTDVIDGYCFADSGEIDRLWLDIKHRFVPEPTRELTPTAP